MAEIFPSQAWVDGLVNVLNSDRRYAEIARDWEGDLIFAIEPDSGEDPLESSQRIYLDLWHGQCRGGQMIDESAGTAPSARYVLTAPRSTFLKILSGELDALQAMLTRRLRVEGSLAYMLRNVPTVLDFVRCARQVEISFEPAAGDEFH